MNIRSKDLNLLAIFAGISEELNLTRASGRLGLSQPALSHALARLREQFGDALFVRGQRGLVATPKAGELLPRVRELLGAAERLYAPGEKLDLGKINRKVVIAATAYFETRAVARFIKYARTQAPGLQLETRSLSGGFPKRELEAGEFDLAIAAYFDAVPGNCKMETIFEDRFVCVCAKKNPYLKTKRTTEDYLSRKHLQIEVPAGVFAPADQYLAGKKRRRNISIRIGNFLTPPAILHQSEFLLTCPRSLADSYREMYSLMITELPFELPGIATKMAWHEKNHHDPFHVWLRSCVAEVENRSSGKDFP